MEKNVGGIDRIARFIIGPALILVGAAALAGALALAGGTTGLVLAALALLVGAVLTTTAIVQRCPLNSIIGLNTYRAADRRAETAEPEAEAGHN